MAIVTQRDLATQMIRQLRILDPSASADLGTPERKIIDTVSQALADAQVDLTVLTSALDIDSKYGSDLDNFLAIFSFARQKGSASIGIIEFSRVTPSEFDIVIPQDTMVAAISADSTQALFRVTEDATLIAGDLAVLVPIRAINVGAANNIAANQITSFGGAIITGITDITNPTPTTGGVDPESDPELKVRFRNTLFRNLAGTNDQFLALAVTGIFTNKANVVGPVSRYREYIQVPSVDDATSGGGGSAGNYTTDQSTVPNSAYTYTGLPTFVSNGQSGFDTIFYTEGVDFQTNAPPLHVGDLLRDQPTTYDLSQPNVTFLNTYSGVDDAVEAIRPTDVVLFEHSYLSSVSRNDPDRAITNCVDVFINGVNETTATTVIPKPTVSTIPFQNNPTHRYHYDNYRRYGEPEHRPVIGNIFTPLFWTPIESLPDVLFVGNYVYRNGVHYWPVIDVSTLGGTIRSRTGIEWSVDAKGEDNGALTGPRITANTATSIQVTDYTFDKNVIDLQNSIEGSKQTTTDVLIHKATQRYFKLDLTLMYTSGSSTNFVNQSVGAALKTYYSNIYFGSVIQLSDLLQVVHGISGVDNVRWTNDLDSSIAKVIETDVNGVPLLGGVVDRFTTGDGSTHEIQHFYLTGSPNGGTYKLTDGTTTSTPIAYNANQAAVSSACSGTNFDVTSGTGTSANPFVIRFNAVGAKPLVTVQDIDLQGVTTFDTDFFLGDDELATTPVGALSSDSVPGLILRRRAQNTWQ